MDRQRLTTSEYYVAYLDILGTKDIVKKDKNDKYLNALNSIYQNAILQAQASLANYNNKEFFVKIFSDNILIAINLEENERYSKTKLERLINLVGLIQLKTLEKGYLLRGAIAKGDFCKNDIFVHGKALVDAVILEENNAIYPRIILQSPAEIARNFANIDNDGYFYVDSYFFSGGNLFYKYKDILLKLLKKYRDNNKVKQKIMWSISYHNDFINNRMNELNLCPSKPLITDEEINNATN